MSGSWVLMILIFISSLPVIAVYIWFRLAKYQLPLVKFLFALLAGAAAFFPAVIMQDFLNISFSAKGRGPLFYEFFFRIAFTEEISRFLMLFIFFWINKHFSAEKNKLSSFTAVKEGTAIGLIAGLGFALLENARYAASEMNIVIVILRIFTAAIHGACGSRIGAAAVLIRTSPTQAFLRILTATAIHGIYNLMVSGSGLSPFAAILIAISALITTIITIRGGWNTESSIPDNELDKTVQK
ncbi:MAG: PrsW family glutamic-type intramembrane protease [Treponema sp.]|nr:PrsW family glutamic-type intramembrane protease [Treponema sp.]